MIIGVSEEEISKSKRRKVTSGATDAHERSKNYLNPAVGSSQPQARQCELEAEPHLDQEGEGLA